MLTYLVLGPIELLTAARRRHVPGTLQQTLLATFLAAGDTPIAVDALTTELWGGTPPAKAENALQAQISRLRRTLRQLEPQRAAARLAATPLGYRMAADHAESDADRFVATTRPLVGGPHGDPARAIVDLRLALSAWRGPVFGGITGGPICHRAVAWYEQSRLRALETLYDLELRRGGHARVVPELTELVTRNRESERLCTLLMVALYRCGRQRDALELCRRMRGWLAEDLGAEPSTLLRRCEEAIRHHDPRLAALAEPVTALAAA